MTTPVRVQGMTETEEQQRSRFQIELEFVQCLANPNYLNYLAQRNHFKDPCFINYLKYLMYWKEPEYAKYLNDNLITVILMADNYVVTEASNKCCTAIKTTLTLLVAKLFPSNLTNKNLIGQARGYPQCLHFLELLQYEHFRKELSNAQCAKFIEDQQLLQWQHYHRKRMRLIEQAAQQQQQQSASQQPPQPKPP